MGHLRIVDSFSFAFEGFREALRTERNLRIDMIGVLVVFFICALLRIRGAERAILVFLAFFVIAFELVNTAIETAVDTWVLEHHLLAKRAKDISAAAVLAGAIGSLVVGFLIIIPRIQELIKSPFFIGSDQVYWLLVWVAALLLFCLWCFGHPLESKYPVPPIDIEVSEMESD